MLFHEIYGSYFRVVAAVLEEAVCGTLTAENLGALVRNKAFAESVLTIPAALQSGEWPLLDETLHTPLHHVPSMPLTKLEKRWLKALLLDKRIQLFSPPIIGLDEVDPLFIPEMFVYFDRYTDGDPYESSRYIAQFQTILVALQKKCKLYVKFEAQNGHIRSCVCIPYRLEYSSKDDKFRLITADKANSITINIVRITQCELLEPYPLEAYQLPIPNTQYQNIGTGVKR